MNKFRWVQINGEWTIAEKIDEASYHCIGSDERIDVKDIPTFGYFIPCPYADDLDWLDKSVRGTIKAKLTSDEITALDRCARSRFIGSQAFRDGILSSIADPVKRDIAGRILEKELPLIAVLDQSGCNGEELSGYVVDIDSKVWGFGYLNRRSDKPFSLAELDMKDLASIFEDGRAISALTESEKNDLYYADSNGLGRWLEP